MNVIIGIDLGTTNFAVCTIENGRPKLLQDGQQNRTFPSAINTNMWLNPITQRNFRILKETGRFHFLLPVEKRLACGDFGVGGLADPVEILKECNRLCLKS